MNIIVFDLDGTLANGAHREHHLREDPKDWDSYFAKCGEDVPFKYIQFLYEELCEKDNYVEIWTARIDTHMAATYAWIREHFEYAPRNLRMRKANDRTDDYELKRQWLQEVRAAGNEVILVFEDRQRVVDMWRAEGVVCCQVAKGDF